MPFSMAALNQGLSGLATNPLFNLGLGMLSTPYQRTPVSFGQVLGNGVSQMDYAQAQAAKQQQAQMQAQLLQQRVADSKTQAAAQQAQRAAQAKYVASLGPNASPAQAYLASTDPGTLAAQQYKEANVNPWTLPKGATGEVNLRSGEVRPLTIPGVNAPAGQSPATGGLPAGLPPETQAYVPKVMAALGGAPAFQNGQPTPQLLDAVQHVESGGNPNAVSPAGAQGPYQFMPATAASVGVTNPFDPVQARQGASRYLTQLDQRFGNPQAAIAAYNAGPGRVQTALAAPTIPMAMQQRVAQVLYGNKTASTAKLPTGYQWNADHTAAMPIPGTKAASEFQGAATTPLPGDPTLAGTDYIGSIKDQGTRDLTQSYLSGSAPAPTGTALKNTAIRTAWAAALHADPTLNAGTYKQRADTRLAFTKGRQGDMIRQLNNIAQHANQYAGDVATLNNGGLQPLNAIENTFNAKFHGNTAAGAAPGAVDTDALALSEEVSKYLTGGKPDLTTMKEWQGKLGSNQAHTEQITNLTRVLGIVGGQMNSLVHQYKSGMGSLSEPLGVVAPDAVQAFQHLVAAAKTAGVRLPPHVTELEKELNVPTEAVGPQAPAAAAPAASGWSIQQVQ
jgi:soluble lytic murein transglycosylase-like protein